MRDEGGEQRWYGIPTALDTDSDKASNENTS